MPIDEGHRKNFDDLVLHLHEAIDSETMDAKVVVTIAKLVRFAGPFLFNLQKQVDDLDRRLERIESRLGRIEKVLEATTSLRARSLAG
ncbi:MAG: hypothetical protein A3F84_16185 [Candidatus Handelsmanbacteria bacterium RIFCSPLOWO2_12_FULL_64_10]|uniref:Uncharacterized protein n=1 Tax=Handelsmanbacteria sp. (strain RIFCSPLOWO2_12_FULL_64_10) TaxID=1817868 RepID=A0A1F6CSZ1_HANXR|nr:MAG: hypothetical protein A3F84_16185 [Candidatus Handelsmanbacteria bacterium RIFCSPLOWO2_12_FULL_64_10]